eukprot:182676-Rhodomonas_salina.2
MDSASVLHLSFLSNQQLGNYDASQACYTGRPLSPLPEDEDPESGTDEHEMPSGRLCALANTYNWEESCASGENSPGGSSGGSSSPRSSEFSTSVWDFEWSLEKEQNTQKPSWCLDEWDVITVPGPDGQLHLGVWC